MVKWLVLLGLLGCLIVATQPICAQETASSKKIRDVSPDQKFALRVSCSAEPEDPNNIDSSLITAVELVSLPSKKVVVNVGQDYEGSAPYLIWSRDSNWFAYPLTGGPRVTDTYVYHRSGDNFGELNTENLRVDIKGDVRNQYVKPLRWVKPGVLLLEQYIIFRGGNGNDSTYRFTASFDEKSGNFRIISKKKIPSRVSKED
jgi:hypothetical protein